MSRVYLSKRSTKCFFFIGLTQSNAEEQQLAPLKRSVRSAMQGLSAAMFEKVKKTVVKTCVENGHQDGDDLEQEDVLDPEGRVFRSH
ncbi:unnamed protein product [Callosobruchus maculatus]|uniref:Uncharacterized protein n=1 Tax=Callosobruchus maculatus TaxID=64391 RepID=A0A653C8G1_CALMS|nr:unnamed protein product [Callosobruchus maculatus]